MTKIDALRRFFLPCISPPSNVAAAAVAGAVTGGTKKRLSTSLRDDIIDQDSTSSASADDEVAFAVSGAAPQRPSKTMVIGTIFGRKKGHVWFCVQHDRLSTKPLLLLELSIATNQLVYEMGSGLVRVALECPARAELSACPLRSVPVWTMYCNGRKVGFAVRRNAKEEMKMMLKKLQSTTVGAGVMPSDPDELMYMRANYEHVVGNSDSESFHLINPDVNSAQELSIFLLRTPS